MDHARAPLGLGFAAAILAAASGAVALGCASETRPPVVVFLGPPGAGKSTQARRLGEAHALPVVSTGELMRAEAARGTPLGRQLDAAMARGELVPDDVVDRIVAERIARSDCARGFIVDGYPRTVAQARYLDGLLARNRFAPPTVLDLDAPDDVLIARLAGRGRADDTPETVARRLAIHRAENQPLLDYYRAGDYHRLRGDQTVDEVAAAIEAALPASSRRAR